MTRAEMEAAIGMADGLASRFARESAEHGPKHWRDVAYLGLLAIRLGVPADPDAVVLFGAFHDTQRAAERDDPYHGPRAVPMVAQFAPDLPKPSAMALRTALDWHSASDLSALGASWSPERERAIIAACFDADRVTLPRVGVDVDETRLATGEWLGISLYRLVEEGAARAEDVDAPSWDRILKLWERTKLSLESAGS